jgi:hypothetical protein
MSIINLTGRLKEVFKEEPTSLQLDGMLYLTKEEWGA